MKKIASFLIVGFMIFTALPVYAEEEDSVNIIIVDNINVESENGNSDEITPHIPPILTPSIFNVAWANGIKIVEDNYNHKLTAELMSRAKTGPFTTKNYVDGTRASNLVENDTSFKKILNTHKSSMKIVSNESNVKTFDGSSTFTSGELYTALNKYNYEITLMYNGNTKKWTYFGYIDDQYDFKWSLYDKTYNNFAVTLGNNVAAYGQSSGLIKEFPVRIVVSGNL